MPVVGNRNEVEIQKVLILEYIANELAEANRLKRIELEMKVDEKMLGGDQA